MDVKIFHSLRVTSPMHTRTSESAGISYSKCGHQTAISKIKDLSCELT